MTSIDTITLGLVKLIGIIPTGIAYQPMSKPYIDTIKTIAQGALGAVTFGAYHQFTTNRIMELNNEKLNLQHQYFIDKMETQHRAEMDEVNRKLKIIEQKGRWWPT